MPDLRHELAQFPHRRDMSDPCQVKYVDSDLSAGEWLSKIPGIQNARHVDLDNGADDAYRAIVSVFGRTRFGQLLLRIQTGRELGRYALREITCRVHRITNVAPEDMSSAGVDSLPAVMIGEETLRFWRDTGVSLGSAGASASLTARSCRS
jgi:hypothetical protein